MKQKYAAWLDKTEQSDAAWKLDSIMEANRTALFYKGAQSGYFIELSGDNQVDYGTYAGATPNIFEADFQTLGTKWIEGALDIQKDAITIFKKQGAEALLNYIGNYVGR